MTAWTRKVRRRRPGIYLALNRKHANPRRRENGYVGKSVHLAIRHEQHMGRGKYGAPAQPWSDLDPIWRCVRLPWWLGWPWVLLPLEFLAIRLLLPRYNVTHNLGNPRRINQHRARAQRAQRDAIARGAVASAVMLDVQRQADTLWRILAALFLLGSILMIARASWS
jgi:hypothetical protein